MSGAIYSGKAIEKDVSLEPDVCIVGSGAGGSVTAARLAAAGKSVVVLEEGGYYTKEDFDLVELTTYARLYQERGLRATTDTAIAVLQGRTVGGSTTVNWTSSFRTPKRILEHWAEHHGVDTISEDVLTPHFEAVEKRLNIHEWPVEKQNPNNNVLWRGAGELGWHRGAMRRNVLRCMDSGYCGFGCPVDAKQAMHLTFLPDAVAAGAVVYADTSARKIETRNNKVVAVHAEIIDRATHASTGRRITVRPKLLVVSGGAINTPLLMLRSKLNRNGRVGRRTFLHPATALPGIYDDRIRPFYGAPQSAYSHEPEVRDGRIGYFLEAAPLQPMLGAAALGGYGKEHQAQLAKLPNTAMLAFLLIDGLLADETGGTIGIRDDGRPDINYPLGELQMEAFRAAHKTVAELHFAAGAKEVRSMHHVPVVMKSKADIAKLDDAPWEPLQFPIFTFHQMGGSTMGKDPVTSVVDPRLKHHDIDNLYIVDGSVLPTALGVNPAETIYGIAHWAAEHIAAAV